jgi:hypothetical protein
VATELKSMFSWIKTLVSPQPAIETPETSETQMLSSLDFDPAWHGDHWQNLLASPMDARRYVMEDWTIPRPLAFDDENTDAFEEREQEEVEPAY